MAARMSLTGDGPFPALAWSAPPHALGPVAVSAPSAVVALPLSIPLACLDPGSIESRQFHLPRPLSDRGRRT